MQLGCRFSRGINSRPERLKHRPKCCLLRPLSLKPPSTDMSILSKIFGGGSTATTASRAIAKDRLSVILASQRGSELLEGVNMEELQRDVLKVVERHINIAKNRPVNFTVNAEGDVRIFEMQIELAGRLASRG